MDKKSRVVERRVTSFGPGKRWRFVKTKLGIEYCVDGLRFRGKKLEELECYRIEENGTVDFVHLRPSELDDVSEIAEFLTPAQN
ncbi:MAG: hypothetical protein WBW16_07565 [Bacteroidota bacterium]